MSVKSMPQKVHEFPASSAWDGRRMKEVLRELAPELSSRDTVLVVKNGLVSVGDAVAPDLDTILDGRKPIRLDLRHGVHGKGEPSRPTLVQQMRVLHDDDDLVVVSKAEGIVVQPTPDESAGRDRPLVELLKHYWRAKEQQVVNPILVQRLDKATSGLMVLGKTVPASRHLQRQAAGRFMERRYLALVERRVRGEKGVWRSFIGIGEVDGLRQSVVKVVSTSKHAPGPDDEGAATDGEDADGVKVTGGREAITHYTVVEVFERATLIECRLETGRTHQIRIHCAEAGHPIIGDPVYFRLAYKLHPTTRFHAGVPDAPRMMLHAARLKFQHPSDEGKWLTFRDDPPAPMADYIQRLRTGEDAPEPEKKPTRFKKPFNPGRPTEKPRAGKPSGKPTGKPPAKASEKPRSGPANSHPEKSGSKPFGKPRASQPNRPTGKPTTKGPSRPAGKPRGKGRAG